VFILNNYLNLEIILLFYFILLSLNYLVFQYPSFLRFRGSFIKGDITPNEVLLALKGKGFPRFSIQITTKGGEAHIIKEGLEVFEKIYQILPAQLAQLITVDLLSENADDIKYLNEVTMSFGFNFHVVPKDYLTPNGTQLKARALQYMIDQRQSIDRKNNYIIHLDAESILTLQCLCAIMYSVGKATDKQVIFQGPIFYPHYWNFTNPISKQMESLRPWNCYECRSSTDRSYPFHLHGSNLVVREDIEKQVGWDFGLLYGYPLVAEDLLFGLRAYLLMGKSAFAWHGGILLEQPGLSVADSIKQRIRWIRGTLQAQALLQTWPEFQDNPKIVRTRIKRKLWFKIVIYAAGFIPASISLVFILYIITTGLINGDFPISFNSLGSLSDPYFLDAEFPRYIIVIPFIGMILWLLSIQIGLYHNLSKTDLGLLQKIKDHILILLITPIATLIETGAVLFTVLSWSLGRKNANWEITPKISMDQIEGEVALPEIQ
jgi:hypothetical protein